RNGGIPDITVQDILNVLNFGLEIISTGFFEKHRFVLASRTENDGIRTRLVVDPPIDIAIAALNANTLFRRGGDDVLDYISYEPISRAQTNEARSVVERTFLLHYVECCGNVGNAARSQDMGEMLPHVDCVGMFSGSPATAL